MSLNKIVDRFVVNLLKFRMQFKDILTILVLNYRDLSFITLYFVVPGISVPKNKLEEDLSQNCWNTGYWLRTYLHF